MHQLTTKRASEYCRTTVRITYKLKQEKILITASNTDLYSQ